MEKIHQRANMLIALGMLVTVFVSYLSLLAPSISFWDCSEYVSAGASLGIPHPPGNPLYVLLARTAVVALPFINDTAYRINLLTPIFGALTSMLVYLSIVRVFISFIGIPDTNWKRISIYLGGIVGTLFAAFSNTVLFCAVEAEVNLPVLLPIMFSIWLTLVWSQSKDPKRDRLLLLATYISFLGIAIHMFSMIVLLPIFIFVLIMDKTKRYDWRVWVTCILMGLVMYNVSFFLYCAATSLVITGFMIFAEKKNSARWRLCFQIVLVASLGFSVHLFVPIRSNLEPMINENHPNTYQKFKDYLDRKQYGNESMIKRMLHRRADWQNQFGVEGHMGFGGFWSTQFFRFTLDDTKVKWFSNGPAEGTKKLVIYMIPTLFMLLGFYLLYKRNRSMAFFLILFTFLNTIAMVYYHNFADGNRGERREMEMWTQNGKQGPQPKVQREVRVRDYFYITGFMMYGMWMGLSTGLTLLALYSNRRKFLSTTVAPVATILFAVSPAIPMTQNMPINDRSEDTIPYDYAYNLLMSCEPNGIMFTNGDNDTFPVWAIQEAFGVRKDVRIVNLSLLNTDWYIKQLKDLEPKVPITYTDDEIDRLDHEYNPYEQSFKYRMPNADLNVTIPGQQQLQVMQIQHKMIVHIVDANKWKKPIYFANTVSDDNFMGLDPYLSMAGFAYRIMPDTVSADMKFDIEKTEKLIDSVYKFRGLNSWRAQNDETTENLVGNYSALFLKIGLAARENQSRRNNIIDSLTAANQSKPDPAISSQITSLKAQNDIDINRALNRLEQCTKLISWDWRPYMLRQELLVSIGKKAEAEQEIINAVKANPNNVELLRLQAQILFDNNKKSEAVPILKKLASLDGEPDYAYYQLFQIYQSLEKWDSAKIALQDLKKRRPNDIQIQQLIDQIDIMSKNTPAALPESKPATEAAPAEKK
jgi:hypothetical protein